ncbi:apolipoprotein N-acyltransferase [Actibacterium sp. D379-3]
MRGWPAFVSDGAARGPALLAAFGFGGVASAGQAPFGLWPVALLGFAGLFALILPARSPWGATRLAWLGGAGYFGAALIWIVQPFLVDVARDGWMAPFALALMGFGLALFWGAAGYAAAWLRAGRPGRALALVATLTAAELARSYVLTGFPWALIGHMWIDSPALQLAAVTGAHGLTVLALLAVLLPLGFGLRGLAAAVALVAGVFAFGALRLAQPVIPAADAPVIRLIQPNAAQSLKWRDDMMRVFLRRQLGLTATPSDPMPDLIVWPETAIPYTLHSAGPVLAQIAGAAGGVPVVLGIQRRDAGGVYNSAIAIDALGQVSQLYDKHHLVPFGEYMPLAALFARIGVFGLAAGDSFGYASGPGARVWDLGALGDVLPLICYEAIFPQDLRAAPRRADWVLQITNDAWFGTFSGPYQHLAQARLRAVEQGLPVLRAANTGVSAAIGPMGRVLGQLPLNTAGQLTVPLPPALPPTPYARLGDWPALVLIVLALAGLARRRAAESD